MKKLKLVSVLSSTQQMTRNVEIGSRKQLQAILQNSNKKKKHKVGYHFRLTNDELINYYLKKKVQGIDLQQLHNAINEVDIINVEPRDLPAISAIKSEDSYWYFFYRLEDSRKRKRGAGGNNRTLNSGKGKWKTTGMTRTLRSDKTNQPIGTKKTLVFERPSDKTKTKAKDKVRAKSQTEWTIHEYHLPSDFPNPDKYVIIELKKKGGKAVASSPEEGKSSYLPEKAKEIATSSIVNDVEFDNHPPIGFEESSLSSCMDDTPSLANQVDNPPADLEASSGCYKPLDNVNPELSPHCQGFQSWNDSSVDNCIVQTPLAQANLKQNFGFMSEDNEEDLTFKKLCEDLLIVDTHGLHCSVDSMS